MVTIQNLHSQNNIGNKRNPLPYNTRLSLHIPLMETFYRKQIPCSFKKASVPDLYSIFLDVTKITISFSSICERNSFDFSIIENEYERNCNSNIINMLINEGYKVAGININIPWNEMQKRLSSSGVPKERIKKIIR